MRFYSRPAKTDPHKAATVLLPGWATDHRIFEPIAIDGPSVIVEGPLTRAFPERLAEYLSKEGLFPVSLFGWSLGGAAALQFTRVYPEMLNRLILFGLRPRYPADALDAARRGVIDDKEAYLTSFYRTCFLPAQRGDYAWFKRSLLTPYLHEMAVTDLLASLDYLGECAFSPADVTLRDTTILHGAWDSIAPIAEIEALIEASGASRFHVLPNAAHAPFLLPEARTLWTHD
jgi:pimeloyl-ACP methyl ester carboxylesterase